MDNAIFHIQLVHVVEVVQVRLSFYNSILNNHMMALGIRNLSEVCGELRVMRREVFFKSSGCYRLAEGTS